MKNIFPPIPADTVHTAEASFGKGNIYLTIGDHADLLFNEGDLRCLYNTEAPSLHRISILAMITIFQFVEDLANRQAAEATRTRTDWKYALHLPLDYPGLDASRLCDFRARLLRNAEGQLKFGGLLKQLTDIGLLQSGKKSRTDTLQIIDTVCLLNRVEVLARTIYLAMETLAVRRPESLRMIALPHWYEKYSHAFSTFCVPRHLEKLNAYADAMGHDASHLLESVAKFKEPRLTRLPEIRDLRRVTRQQFRRRQGDLIWRSDGCADCEGIRK